MTIKTYEGSQAFLKDFETVLLEHEALSQRILYNARLSRNKEQIGQEMYGAVLNEESAILLFCNGMAQGLIIYAVNSENIVQAINTLADYLGNSNIIINGINATNDICISFIEQYKELINCTFTEKIGIYIMETRKVNDIKPVEGTQRLATIEEAKIVAEWMIDYQLETFTSEMDYEAALKKASDYINENKVFLYENSDNLIVSMAVSEHRLVHGVVITYAFTPEEHRGKGYAAANIYYLSKELLEQGYEFCTLFVDKKNPLSGRAYEKVGYVILGDIYEYKVIPFEG